MNFVLLADWSDFVGVVVVVISILSWVISQFSGEAAKQQQKRGPQVPPNPPADEPEITLHTEIDEFVRQAREKREGRSPEDRDRPPKPDRPPQRGRPTRRQNTTKRGGRRQPADASSSAEPIIELVEEATRESVAQHVAQAMGSSTFDKRLESRDQFQKTSDADFHGHMDRVFSNDLGSLKTTSAGIFERAPVAVAATTASSVSEPQSAKALPTANKAATDIAVFLAGRKNVRDAIVLGEILNRPEHRW